MLPQKLPRIDFEFTAGCDHRCSHCYNVWNADDEDPQGGYVSGKPLKGAEMESMVDKVLTQTQASHVTVTGGEPLLRSDALNLIAQIGTRTQSMTLITNGSHVDEKTAQRLKKIGISQVQLTILSGDRDQHNRLKGAICFDDTLRAAATLVQKGVQVSVCFVAMKENADTFPEVMDICLALGVKNISYNRMSPTGGAVHHIKRLMPTIEQIEANLETAQHLGPKYGIRVATAMPILPCMIRMERYPWVNFGLCSTGSDSPNIVVDSLGNVRSCNLASGILGNFLQQDWDEIRQTNYQQSFKKDIPEMCKGCAYERSCQGGCKESAFAVFGSHNHPEPLLWLALDEENRQQLPRYQRIEP